MGTFSLLYVSGTCLDLLRYGLGLLQFRYYTGLGLVLFRYVTSLGLVLFRYYTSLAWSSGVLEFWSGYVLGHVPHRVLYWIRIVCQVGGTPQMYLRSFEVDGKP